ncbi:TPA: hypothetical protein PP871_001285 [Staphylococcus aureus]|nr:hypothetical protein [Staphylococcus aureus]HDJ2939799.1 hypothetical protein [Staphylococcus aureus]HDJ3115454.1 hypothetical protein [Staphylococcus aureus]HDJ3128002.1 hypothetical protein [Staphylococcus aureus]
MGPQQREIGFPISTDNVSWRGPNIEAGGKSAYNNVHLEYMYNNIKHAVKRSQSIQTDFTHRVFLT